MFLRRSDRLVAQLVARRLDMAKVVGSIPTQPTNVWAHSSSWQNTSFASLRWSVRARLGPPMKGYAFLSQRRTEVHEDPFEACDRCSWDNLCCLPQSSDGGSDYACLVCGLLWRQLERGVLTNAAGRMEIPVGADCGAFE